MKKVILELISESNLSEGVVLEAIKKIEEAAFQRGYDKGFEKGVKKVWKIR